MVLAVTCKPVVVKEAAVAVKTEDCSVRAAVVIEDLSIMLSIIIFCKTSFTTENSIDLVENKLKEVQGEQLSVIKVSFIVI